LDPLNAAITWYGFEPFPVERVITPDYRAALRQGTGSAPTPNTWKRPSRDIEREAITEYVARMSSLETRLRPLANASPPRITLPEAKTIPPIPKIVNDAKRYLESSETRALVHEIVLRSLGEVPEGSEIVVVGHSLGSVVAAEVIKKLPRGLTISVLLTIGSPLGAISAFRDNHDLSDFPYDRVRAWVNVFEPRDVVTGGKGVASHYPTARDFPVLLPDGAIPHLIAEHGAEYYCTHPAVAAAITGALHGTELATTDPSSDRGVQGLELLLLQSVYLRELAKRLPTKDRERVEKFERARVVTAANHCVAAQVLHDRDPLTAALPASAFLVNPDLHIRGAWDDRTMLALAIMLAGGQPATPFDIEEEADTEERRLALVATLSLVRDRQPSLTDVDIVDAIFLARKQALDCFSRAPGLSWLPVALLGAGVLTLAATGIGLTVAAPAGLAGAALITSTLAAFGPGGMVGGMATLAALASAGSAMAAAGATLGATGISRQAPDLLARALDEAIASLDPNALRSLLVSLLTLVDAQERLSFPTQRDAVLFACTDARARVSIRAMAHEQIDPRSTAAKAAHKMLGLLSRAELWLRGAGSVRSTDARELAEFSTAYDEALHGHPAELNAALRRPVRGRPEVPAIGQ
jgi:hypothetical protein